MPLGSELCPVVIGPAEYLHDGLALSPRWCGRPFGIALDLDLGPDGQIFLRLSRDVVVLVEVSWLVIVGHIVTHTDYLHAGRTQPTRPDCSSGP